MKDATSISEEQLRRFTSINTPTQCFLNPHTQKPFTGAQEFYISFRGADYFKGAG